ncbi:hypothetical protein [Sphaerisporangium sp. NPDC051011]
MRSTRRASHQRVLGAAGSRGSRDQEPDGTFGENVPAGVVELADVAFPA